MWNAIQKYGWNSFKHEILFFNIPEENAYYKEVELINFYKSNNPKFGYNISSGGKNAHLGCKHTRETRNKMSKNHANFKGKNSTSSIKIICLDTLQIFDSIGDASRYFNISISGIHNVLKKKSKSYKKLHFEYLEKYNLNKKYDLTIGFDDNTKIKISKSKKGKATWNKGKPFSENARLNMQKAKHKISKKIICIETGQIFPSINNAGKILNLNSGNISLACLHKRKTVNNLHFEYYIGDKNEIKK